MIIQNLFKYMILYEPSLSRDLHPHVPPMDGSTPSYIFESFLFSLLSLLLCNLSLWFFTGVHDVNHVSTFLCTFSLYFSKIASTLSTHILIASTEVFLLILCGRGKSFLSSYVSLCLLHLYSSLILLFNLFLCWCRSSTWALPCLTSFLSFQHSRVYVCS